jgi:hypothetical protein
MAKASQKKDEGTLSSLAEGAIEDLEKLVRQNFDLLRSELQQGLDDAKNAALSMGVGAGLAATGGILGTVGLVHLIHRTVRLPLWACYGVVGGVLGAVGGEMLCAGARKAADVQLIPRQTAEVLKEELTGR